MDSPYAPPASNPEPPERRPGKHPKRLWILAYIIGITTLFLAGVLMFFTDKLRSMEHELGMSFSLLTQLLLRHRRLASLFLGACGLLGILGSFTKSKFTMLGLIILAGIAATTIVTLLAVAYLDFREAISPLLH